MKHIIFLLIFLSFVSCTKEYYFSNDKEQKYEKVITDYGAVGDGKKDCSALINKLIEDMPASGGVIVIPEGDWVLDNPIVINRNFVTIKGVNPGMRSNIDVADLDDLLGPGGGSKLILRNAEYGIHIPQVADVNGAKNRISGVEIKDLMLSGGKSNKGTGIFVEQDNDRCQISNVIDINLDCGIRVNAADAMIIKDSWICEVANSIVMNNGIQNMITNCQLGAQPAGVTCKLVNQTNLVFSSNHVYPDGMANLILDNCNHVNISNNNFKSFYVGILDLKGDDNLVSSNIFWMDRGSDNQFMGKESDYGVIRIDGSSNMITSNIIKCNWNIGTINPVTVRSVKGKNRFSDILIDNLNSNRVFYVAETDEILHCVDEKYIQRDREETFDGKVGYLIAGNDMSAMDDDESASLEWFKNEIPNGDIITSDKISSVDLSLYDIIWVHIDREGSKLGWNNLPSGLISDDVIASLKEYYINGGKLLLCNHAIQLLVPLGRIAENRAPTIWGSGIGGENSDVWGINANIGLVYDHRSHLLFEGLSDFDGYGHSVFPLIGSGYKEDHNCMWDLNVYGYPELYPGAGNVVAAFEQENDAVVLGTWQHVTDFCCAGVVEFKPNVDCKGTCIAIGVAAYEWMQNAGNNVYQSNIEQLTSNAIKYLGNL